VHLRNIDPERLTRAWKHGWATLPDDQREQVMAHADAHGGVPNRLMLEPEGDVVVTMAGVEVVRCPARTLVRRPKGTN